ncbi:hypothetical protein LINPERHAP2_LOCUS44055 [Linum perenne]
MVSAIFASLAQSSLHSLYNPSLSSPRTPLGIPKFTRLSSNRRLRPVCFFNNRKEKPNTNLEPQKNGSDWQVLERWDVPWEWPTVSLTSLACGISFVLTGFVEVETLPFLGIKFEELNLDQKAELLFLDQSLTTAVVLGVLYSITKSFGPLPEDIFRYDFKEPFNLKKGWLLWAGLGLGSAVLAIVLTGYVVSAFHGEPQERDSDSLVRLLPLIGSSGIRVPIPFAVVISAAVFALAHLSPGQFPQLFVLGTLLGFSYAQTRNLLTPITIHAFWNSGVILILTLLQMATLLKLKSEVLRKALHDASGLDEDSIFFIISATEFSFYCFQLSFYRVSCQLKPEVQVSESSDIIGPIWFSSGDQESIVKFLESKSDDDDTVLIKVDQDCPAIYLEIENKPDVEMHTVIYDDDPLNIDLGYQEDVALNYCATVTLSTSLFSYVLVCLTSRCPARHLEGRYCDGAPGSFFYGPRNHDVKVSMTCEGIQFSAKGYTLPYKVDELESFDVRKPVSFVANASLLRYFFFLPTENAESVTISALPGSPPRLEFNIADNASIRYDLDMDEDTEGKVEALPDEGDVTEDDDVAKKSKEEALLDEVEKVAGPEFSLQDAIQQLLSQQTQVLKELADLRSIVHRYMSPP